MFRCRPLFDDVVETEKSFYGEERREGLGKIHEKRSLMAMTGGKNVLLPSRLKGLLSDERRKDVQGMK